MYTVLKFLRKKGSLNHWDNEFFFFTERGKKKDQRGDYSQALDFYENGMMLLIRATESNIEEETPENTEHLRFKCLLIHERIEELKNHLDLGRSIKVRRLHRKMRWFFAPAKKLWMTCVGVNRTDFFVLKIK